MVFVIVNNVTKGVFLAGKFIFWLKMKKICDFSLKRGTTTPLMFWLLYKLVFKKLWTPFLNVLVVVLTQISNPGYFYHNKMQFWSKIEKIHKNYIFAQYLKIFSIFLLLFGLFMS